jgi:hypothetical protein
MDVTNGLTDTQAAAVTAALNLAAPELRSSISALISAALRSNVEGPFSDSAVLAAIGAAITRYSP